MNNDLSKEARAARNAYHREWGRKNQDKVREINRRYWEKKAAESAGVEKRPDDER